MGLCSVDLVTKLGSLWLLHFTCVVYYVLFKSGEHAGFFLIVWLCLMVDFLPFCLAGYYF